MRINDTDRHPTPLQTGPEPDSTLKASVAIFPF